MSFLTLKESMMSNGEFAQPVIILQADVEARLCLTNGNTPYTVQYISHQA